MSFLGDGKVYFHLAMVEGVATGNVESNSS